MRFIECCILFHSPCEKYFIVYFRISILCNTSISSKIKYNTSSIYTYSLLIIFSFLVYPPYSKRQESNSHGFKFKASSASVNPHIQLFEYHFSSSSCFFSCFLLLLEEVGVTVLALVDGVFTTVEEGV